MSLSPQITQGTKSGVFILLQTEELDGKTMGLIQGPYDTRYHELTREHDTCPLSGKIWVSNDAWADNYACTECDFHAYYPLGD